MLIYHNFVYRKFQFELPWASCPRNAMNISEPECKSATTYFWYRTTLDASPSMDDSGGLKWWIVLFLLISWTIVFLIVMKGIQSSGKVRCTHGMVKFESIG